MSEGQAARHSARDVFLWVSYLVLCLAGVVLTLYLTAAHFTGQLDEICAPDTGCGAVLDSELAVIFGIPTATYGLLFYTALFLAALFYPITQLTYRPLMLNLAALITGLGMVISLLLTVYSYAVVETFCNFCLASFALVTLLTAVLAYWKQAGPDQRQFEANMLARRGSRIAIKAFAVAAGLFAIFFFYSVGRGEPATTVRLDGHTAALMQPGAVLGDPNAPHEVIEFFDLECPACREFALQVFPEIKERYIDTGVVRWILRPFPLEMLYPNSLPAHVAHELVPFDNYLDAKQELMANAEAWSSQHVDDPLPYLEEFLAGYGLPPDLITDERGAKLAVQRDSVREALGIEGTPHFLIDGELVRGAPSMEQWVAHFGPGGAE